MKIFKPILLGLAVAGLTITATAKPAMPGVRVVHQPDGTELRIKVVGDEFMHFVTTEDGRLLHEDENGFYTFAEISDNGALISTGISATTASRAVKTVNISDIDINEIALKRNVAERRALTCLPLEPAWALSGNNGMQKAPQTGLGLVTSTYPRTGSPKGLIILVEYKDIKFTLPDPARYFGDMINKVGFNEYGAEGSALDYFTEMSGGKFTPSFDVYGPVTLPNNRSYYGGNNIYGDDKNPHLMVTDAIKILDPDVDFSQYDTDKDGYIDNVYVFYAGQGEADGGASETVWPHSWDVRGGGVYLKVDGVTVAHYACSNEWNRMNRPDGVSTFVHEFSHVMGLPDLYTTDYNGSAFYLTPGMYSVLDQGTYNNDGITPPRYGAYELNALGWYEPTIIDSAITMTLDNISTGDFALIATEKNNEFFLFENRQLVGWDAYIPYHGMLIWHIDYNAAVFTNNTVNNSASHQYVDLVEANNSPNNQFLSYLQGYPFPGSKNVTSFTFDTKPSFKSWSGRDLGLPITDITEDAGFITFDVAGGGQRLAVPVATATVPEVGGNYFIASWEPVEGATDYYITVVGAEGGEAGETTNGFDGSALPQGWTSSLSNLEYYSTNTNFGASAPSLKLTTDGHSITSPVTPSDVAKIEFWNKGQSVASSGTSLIIEGLVDGNWVNITEFIPTNLKDQTTVIESEIPAGVRQVRFTMNKKSGNIALDDIVISYGGKEGVLPDYDGASTGGATTVKVDKLREGYTHYYFTVVATNGKQRSGASEEVHVDIDGMSGVDNVTVEDSEATPEYFNLQGVRIDNPASGSIVIERRGTTARKILMK